MAFKVFVSYRREDSGSFVDQLQSELRQQLPDVELLRDIDVIAPGHDFIDVLQAKIDEADVLLAVMGPSWAGAPGGRRRIDDSEDVVRREISWRLRPRDSRTLFLGGPDGGRIETGPEREPPPLLPVLIGGVDMPKAHTLPPDMRALPKFNAIAVSGTAARGFDTGPVLRELARRAADWEREEREMIAELEGLEAEAVREARANPKPPPDPEPQVRMAVSNFSHLGSWTCEIGPASPGAGGSVIVEFVVQSDNSMRGYIVTESKGLFRKKQHREPIQGRADLLFLRPAGANELHPVIRLEGVRQGAQRFLQDIPVQQQLGPVFLGSAAGQAFALKRTGDHGL